MSQFTERQAKDWPEAVAEAQGYVYTSPTPTELWSWHIKWGEENRAGRGHHFDGVWSDGEFLVQICMDVYGYPTVSVSSTDVIHNSADDQCPCEPDTAAREKEES